MARLVRVRTHDHAAAIDLTALERSPRSPARLDALLVDTDIRLREWATWAAPYYLKRGFPVLPAGAVSGGTSTPRDEWPVPVVVVDECVRELYWRLSAAAMAHYFNLDESAAERAAAYARLVEHFTALRQPGAKTARESSREDAFRRWVDRVRWCVRALLR